MQLNFIGIGIATVVQFAIGALWYSVLFGKLWMKMHDCDKLSREELKKMQQAMMPFYGLQLLMTLITTVILAIFLTYVPDWNYYALAGFIWLGFVLPTQVSGVIFGNTEKKWIVKKILVQTGMSLVGLEAAAIILHFLSM
jgi:cytochrome b561